MEVGARRGAHFQLVRQRDVPPQVTVAGEIPNEEDRQCNKNIMRRQQLIGRMEDI